jgi:hypothetical protein
MGWQGTTKRMSNVKGFEHKAGSVKHRGYFRISSVFPLHSSLMNN